MEMDRLSGLCNWFPLTWKNLYWSLNGYGERPLRAFIWFLIFFLTFPCLIYGLGLFVISSSNADVSNSATFWEAFLFILDKATLQRPQWAAPASGWGRLVAGITVLVLPGQLALFFLALRNRLGRRR
jgi:hypothetical protein